MEVEHRDVKRSLYLQKGHSEVLLVRKLERTTVRVTGRAGPLVAVVLPFTSQLSLVQKRR